MHSLIRKLLQKRGIKSVEELSMDERATFDNYTRILNKRELSMDDLKQFVQARIDQIEQKWKDMNIDATRKGELIPYHTVYKTLLQAMNAPQAEREALEQVLVQQIQ